MPQELLNLQDIAANVSGWDGKEQANVVALKGALRTLNMVIHTQGNTVTPSVARIQLQNSNGISLAQTFYLRLRVVNDGAYLNATNATIAETGGTTLVETIIAGKDLVFKSSAAGLLEIICTDAVAETFNLLCGHAPLLTMYGNHNNSLSITHVVV